MRDLRQWENGGYFVLRPEIFDYLNEGEDLVEDALLRLVAQRRVLAYPYKGYWSPADTVKERAQLEEMYHRGHCPWMVWDPERSGAAELASSGRPAPCPVPRLSEPYAVTAPGGAGRRAAVRPRDRRASRRHRDRRGRAAARPGPEPALRSITSC